MGKRSKFFALVLLSSAVLFTGRPSGAQEKLLDSPTPEIIILGAIQQGSDLRIKVEVRNFKMGGHDYTKLAADPKKDNPHNYGMEKQRPNFGHIHVYLAPYNATKPEQFLMVDFLMVDTLSTGDRGEFTIKGVRPGRYRLLVELVKHDHGPRLKAHSNDFPPMDMINVTIGGPDK